MITASTSTGISRSGATCRGGIGCVVMCLVRMPMKVSASNGTVPVNSSYMMTPTE